MKTQSFVFAGAVCAELLVIPASAQTAPLAQEQAAPSDPQAYGLDDIVVTARKREESAQKTPLAISAFGAEAIKQQQIASLADLAGSVPGLTFLSAVNDQFNALVSLRGISTLSLSENLQPSVGIYVDGLYQGFSGANLRDPYDIARIEVVKGPQGTLFGRNTTGGAINVIHNLPTNEWEGWAKVGYGSYNDAQIAGLINAPLAKDVAALRLVASYSQHDGYGRDVFHDVQQANLRQTNVLGTLKLDPTDRFDVVVRGSYEHGTSNNGAVRPTYMEVGGVANLEVAAEIYGLPVINALACAGGTPIIAASCGADLTALPGRLVAAQTAYLGSAQSRFLDSNINQRQDNHATKYTGSLTATYDLSDAIQLKSITGYVHASRYTLEDLDGSPFSVGSSIQDTTSRQFTQEVQLNGQLFGEKLKYTIGGFYYDTHSDELQIGAFLALLADARSQFVSQVHTRAGSLFGQATYALTDRLNLTGGLRWSTETQRLGSQNTSSSAMGGTVCTVLNHVPGAPCDGQFSTNHKNLSYLAEADFTPATDVLLYAKTSRGFRSGGLQESAPGYLPFKPETVTDYEIGAKAELFDRHVRANIALYHQDYSDLQQTVFLVASGASINPVVNVGKATVDGVELQTLVSPTRGFSFGAQATYTNPKYKEFIYPGLGDIKNTPFANVAKWAYSLTADYAAQLDDNTLHFHLDYHWQSKVRFNPVPTLAPEGNGITYQKAYGLLNGRIALDVPGRNLEVAVFGRNLTDKRYFTYGIDFAGSPASSAFGYVLGAANVTPRIFGVEVTKRF